jgi:hypothetical protein
MQHACIVHTCDASSMHRSDRCSCSVDAWLDLRYKVCMRLRRRWCSQLSSLSWSSRRQVVECTSICDSMIISFGIPPARLFLSHAAQSADYAVVRASWYFAASTTIMPTHRSVATSCTYAVSSSPTRSADDGSRRHVDSACDDDECRSETVEMLSHQCSSRIEWDVIVESNGEREQTGIAALMTSHREHDSCLSNGASRHSWSRSRTPSRYTWRRTSTQSSSVASGAARRRFWRMEPANTGASCSTYPMVDRSSLRFSERISSPPRRTEPSVGS